jgi:hypothetical protein
MAKVATTRPKKEKPTGRTKIGIWDYIKWITNEKKSVTDSELRDYEPYLINRFLMQSDALLPIIRMANDVGYVSDKRMHYEFLKGVIPKGYYKLPSMPSTENWKVLKANAELVCSKYNIGLNDLRSFIDINGIDAVNKLAERFKPRTQSR